MFKRFGTEIYGMLALVAFVAAHWTLWQPSMNLFLTLAFLCVTMLFAGAATQAATIRVRR